jgi:hypothetical protein
VSWRLGALVVDEDRGLEGRELLFLGEDGGEEVAVFFDAFEDVV